MNQKYSTDTIHQEHVLQHHVIDQLIAKQGYAKRSTDDFDRSSALDKELVLQFIKATQLDKWKRLEEQYSETAETEFFKQLENALKSRGTLDVLRQGIKLIPDIKFSLCFFKPASGINEELVKLFESNTLSVIDELKYSTKLDNRIDIGLFVNGIPVATIEVKNPLTGQNYRHAEAQYRTDRSPAGEPLLTFKRGAIVHFALDPDMVTMTTRLMNDGTRFLPFNRGREGGAGNADIKGENRIAYLYKDLPGAKAVFSREVLLDLIGRFIHLDRQEGKETLIFPRFQQLDTVRKVLDDARTKGVGRHYLIQHSAGSGKSNTIAWTAHQIINLHSDDDKPIFHSAIIVTDRLILDRQLQRTISGFAHVKGVVETIEGTSSDLKEAIQKGARIIITTIQKFGTAHLATLSGQTTKNFAVIVDEAHSSQSGKSAQAMTDALSRENKSSEDIEDMILEYQNARGPQQHISFLAFTATPRNVTLERFGCAGNDGKPRPFHLYSMRQAIEEGFILDVLKNYSTYEAYYKLEKAIEDNPSFEGRRAQRRVARYASLHPTAIDQKVEVIIEHFRRHVAVELDGNAKAMVVTQGREHALRYWQHINKYLSENGIDNIRALVAFSGKFELDGETWTEASANGFAETELPQRFDTTEYQILVVAEKYQTGFDQPKLVAMYVDKKLAGLQAVQTLSRLNRTYPKKSKTYILDFQNKIEDIKEAFRPFFETTTLEDRTDLNQIYGLEQRVMQSAYLHKDEIEAFATNFFKGVLDAQDRLTLEGKVREAVLRFNADSDEVQQEEFRQLIRSFMRFYSFVAQVVRLNDTWLEKLYIYLSWLNHLLPGRDGSGGLNITDEMLELTAIKLHEQESGSASLDAGDTAELTPITEFGANPYTEEEEKSLLEVIETFNNRHGTNFTHEDFLRFEQINREILNEDMIAMLRNNPADVVYGTFSRAFLKESAKLFQRENQLQNIVMKDPAARDQAISHFFKRAIRAVRR